MKKSIYRHFAIEAMQNTAQKKVVFAQIMSKYAPIIQKARIDITERRV